MTKTSTLVVTTTRDLSAAVDKMLAKMGDASQTPSKSALLNILAAQLAGPKHNWGFLTGAEAPVIQKGIDAARLADLPRAPKAPDFSYLGAALEITGSTLPDLVLTYHPNLLPRRLRLTPADIVLLWVVMRDERSGGTINLGLSCGATIDRKDGEILLTYTRPDEKMPHTFRLDEEELWNTLQMSLERAITQVMRTDPLAEAIHAAFCVVGETDSEISSFLEEGSLTPFDVDLGAQLATVLALEEIDATLQFEFGQSATAATSWVLDSKWPTLRFVLLDEAEPEDRAAQAPHALLQPSDLNPDPTGLFDRYTRLYRRTRPEAPKAVVFMVDAGQPSDENVTIRARTFTEDGDHDLVVARSWLREQPEMQNL